MEIYYAFWAQMREWPFAVRAIVVTGVIIIFCTYILKLIGFRIIALFLQILALIFKIMFVVLSAFFNVRTNEKSIRRWNRISERFEKITISLEEKKKKLLERKKRIAGKMTLLYIILLVCILLPGALSDIVSERYLDQLSYVRNLYIDMENIPLEKSKAYEPLIKKVEEPEQTERILQLSEQGIDGAHIRSEPDKDSKSITVIDNDERMKYVRESNGWIYVIIEDGTEGWIRDYLVEDAE